MQTILIDLSLETPRRRERKPERRKKKLIPSTMRNVVIGSRSNCTSKTLVKRRPSSTLVIIAYNNTFTNKILCCAASHLVPTATFLHRERSRFRYTTLLAGEGRSSSPTLSVSVFTLSKLVPTSDSVTICSSVAFPSVDSGGDHVRACCIVVVGRWRGGKSKPCAGDGIIVLRCLYSLSVHPCVYQSVVIINAYRPIIIFIANNNNNNNSNSNNK
jgi:hypothetical protein